jgi:hypothetical protein
VKGVLIYSTYLACTSPACTLSYRQPYRFCLLRNYCVLQHFFRLAPEDESSGITDLVRAMLRIDPFNRYTIVFSLPLRNMRKLACGSSNLSYMSPPPCFAPTPSDICTMRAHLTYPIYVTIPHVESRRERPCSSHSPPSPLPHTRTRNPPLTPPPPM